MQVGQLVAIKYRDRNDDWRVSKAVLVDRTVNDHGQEEWHALVNGAVVHVDPWQIGPVEIAETYRLRNEKKRIDN
tara:strand:+ start:174 stop:398 length:225 start_codon:yes stop_codon:yes gene_type:complete